MSNIKNNEKGFTLIEIIFSIAFLSIVSVIILKLIVVSFDIEKNTDLLDIATLYAINEVEDVKSRKNIKEDSLEINKYYDNSWTLLPSTDGSSYLIKLEISKSELYQRGLYNIDAFVIDSVNKNEIVHIDTMHYYNYKE